MRHALFHCTSKTGLRYKLLEELDLFDHYSKVAFIQFLYQLLFKVMMCLQLSRFYIKALNYVLMSYLVISYALGRAD